MRVLLVEDDERASDFVVKGLKQAGFSVDHGRDGEEGLHLALTSAYDVGIIDIMLPKKDGLELVEELRRQQKTMPIIILSAKGSVSDRVRGLEAGADDYLPKPFVFTELLARVQALIRISYGLSKFMKIVYANTNDAEYNTQIYYVLTAFKSCGIRFSVSASQ